jgi:hypothetical protein
MRNPFFKLCRVFFKHPVYCLPIEDPYLTTFIVSGEMYKSQTSLLCKILNFPLIYSLSSPLGYFSEHSIYKNYIKHREGHDICKLHNAIDKMNIPSSGI